MQHNIEAVLIDLPVIASPPQELADFVNEFINVSRECHAWPTTTSLKACNSWCYSGCASESDSTEEAVQEVVEAEEIDSDAETIANDSDVDLDIDEMTLRRAMCVRFFRGMQHLFRLQRDEEMVRTRRRLRGIHRRIRNRLRDVVYDAPRRYRDMCYGRG